MAEEGLRKAKGRMDELRGFVAARALEAIDKVRHVLVEVLDYKPRWEKFARKVKQDNLRRSAFQQEFADAVPGRRELSGPG